MRNFRLLLLALLGFLGLSSAANAAGAVWLCDIVNLGYCATVDSGGAVKTTGTVSTVTTVTTVGTITNPVGVKGTDGSTISSASNPVPNVIVPLTSGGVSTFSVNVTTAGAGAGTGGVAVDANPGQLYGYALWNGNSSVCYASFFDASQATTNLGTTAPKLAIGIPALGGANIAFPIGIPFATAITISATTTRNGSTACSTGIDYNVMFK